MWAGHNDQRGQGGLKCTVSRLTGAGSPAKYVGGALGVKMGLVFISARACCLAFCGWDKEPEGLREEPEGVGFPHCLWRRVAQYSVWVG